MKNDKADEVITTICRGHCGGACVLRVHTKDGIITSVETDNGQEPQYRACAKGRALRQKVYAPDRLKFPLKRSGPRGTGEFKRISWDEALDTVASEIKRVRQTYGSSAIMLIGSWGDISWLHGVRLFDTLLVKDGGFSGWWGTVSGEGAWFAKMATYGTPDTIQTRDNLRHSRLIVLWGWNPATTGGYGHPCEYLMQAREAGARIVSIDPQYTDSAAVFADQWIPIIPGTDAAMLIAMAYVMITENLYDHAFIENFTVGFDKFKDYVLGKEDNIPKTPTWAESITGVPATTIVSLAREYASCKPAALMDGYAPGRTAYGEQFHRAVITLAAMTGNIGILGGNAGASCLGERLRPIDLGPRVATRMKVAENPVDLAMPDRDNSIFYQRTVGGGSMDTGPSSARVNRQLVADAILKGRQGGYPADYKLLYISNLNYVNQYGNTNKIIEALKTLEFIVVQEQFMTATARFADILLPTNTLLERNDLTTGGAGPFYGYMNKVVESTSESKSQFEIAIELAAKLGIHDYADKSEEDWLREIVEECKDISDYETFKKEGVHKVELPGHYIAFEEQVHDLENNPFPTPSGKMEIYSQDLADMNNLLIPPIPKYIETWEGRNDPLAKKYPIQLITTHTKRRNHTQFDNIPWLKELYPQTILINTVDAEVRGIKNGDMVRIFNDRGIMIIPAEVTERIMPGVADIPQGAWYNPDGNGVDRGGCANILTKDTMSPGAAFCSNTILVQVEKR